MHRPSLRALACLASVGLFATLGLTACNTAKKRYTTHVEVMKIRQYGRTTRTTDLELRYSDCPGNARKIIRVGNEFAACGAKLAKGDKLEAEIETWYVRDRNQWRDTIVRLGDCPVSLDLKDEANYQMVENCTDLKATGAVVGVHCERGRTDELVAACPWFQR
jgi:hypothetical protein